MASQAQKKDIISIGIALIYAILPIVYAKGLVDNTLIPHQLFAGVGIGAILLLALLRKSLSNWKPNRIVLSMGTFLLVNMIAISAAINPVESYATIAHYILMFSYLTGLIFLLQQSILSIHHLVKGIVVFGTVAGLVTLYEILKALGSGEFISNIYVVSGTFSHKNLLSSVLMLSLPFAIMGSVILKKSWQKLSLILAFLLIAEIFVLRTRGVWLSTFVAAICVVGILMWLRQKTSFKWKIPFTQLGIGGGIAVVLLIALFSAGSISEDVTDATNLEYRVKFWNNSLEMLSENPVLGVGPGNWKINFPKYGLMGLDNNVYQGITHVQRPHNDYLWVLTEGGPLAFVAYFAVFILALAKIISNLKRADNISDLSIDAAAVFGLIAYMVFSLTDFPLERSSHNILLSALLAIPFRRAIPVNGGMSAKFILSGLFILTLGSITVSLYRWQGEKYSKIVLEANAKRNAQRIIPAAANAINPFFNMDNFANPLYYYSSMGKLVQGNTDGAMTDIQSALDIHPYNIISINQLGNVYRAKGNNQMAMETFERALEISPLMEAPQLSLAEMYLDKGDYLSAYAAMRNIVRNSPNPRYERAMMAILPTLVSNYPKHQKYSSLVNYLKSKNPRNASEMMYYFRQWNPVVSEGNVQPVQ